MPIKKKCICGKQFKISPSRVKDGRGKFCSQKCHYKNAKRSSGLKYKIKVVNKGWFTKDTDWKLLERKHKKGNRHHSWKGNDIKYGGLHDWVHRTLGQPRKCELCKKDNLEGRLIHWANKSHRYLRDREDWLRLCAKCHKKYDKKS